MLEDTNLEMRRRIRLLLRESTLSGSGENERRREWGKVLPIAPDE